jgi:hypothetical protein
MEDAVRYEECCAMFLRWRRLNGKGKDRVNNQNERERDECEESGMVKRRSHFEACSGA